MTARKPAPKKPEAPVITTAATEMVALPLSKVVTDPNNPRQTIDSNEVRELAQSIAAVGLINPITVRPHPDKTLDAYIVISGSRRLMACSLVSMEHPERATINAIIRTGLSESEVREIQIIENLQRKDIEPLDEARAFQSLSKDHNLTAAQIAARVGRPVAYVHQRMNLNNLIPEWIEVLALDKMRIGAAMIIAKLSPEAQKEAFDHESDTYWNSKGKWRDRDSDLIDIDEAKQHLDGATLSLDKAPFKTEDADLYPEAGPCGFCPFNTANSPSLFTEYSSRMCTKATCYKTKSNLAYQRTLEEIPAGTVVINSSYGMGQEDSKKLEIAKDMGLPVIESRGLFQIIEEPGEPGSLEDYLNHYVDLDPEDEGYQEQVDEWTRNYQDTVKEYEKELAEYHEILKRPDIQKAFVAVGNRAGEWIDILPDAKVAASVAAPGSEQSIDYQIAELQTREKRNQELDRGKVYQAVLNELSDYENDPNTELSRVEIHAMIMALCDNYAVGSMVAERMDVSWHDKFDLWCAIRQVEDLQALFHSALRKFVKTILVNNVVTDYMKQGHPAAIMALISELNPERVQEAQNFQRDIAAKRQERLEQRIKDLRK